MGLLRGCSRVSLPDRFSEPYAERCGSEKRPATRLLPREASMKRLLVRSRVLLVTTLIVVTLVSTLQATTDSIRIVRGTLFQPNDLDGDLSIEGTSGLKIDAVLAPHVSSLAWSYCHLYPCLAGDELSLFSGYGAFVFTGSGTVTWLGDSYTLWTGPDSDFRFEFDGVFVLPEFTGGPAEVTAPFTFSGSLRVPNGEETGAYEDFELYGAGVATVTLVPHPFTLTTWVVASVRYDFLPRADVMQE
jgi:hypothetical protein